MDIYEARKVLGVAQGTSDEELKLVYRQLAKQYHPDVNPDAGAARRFQEITAAYKLLREGGAAEPVYEVFREEDLRQAWREEQKAKRARQDREKALQHQQTLQKVYRVLNVLVVSYMIFLFLLMLDYVLPRREHQQEITEVVEVYEAAGRYSSRQYHSHNRIYFSDFSMQVSKEELLLPASSAIVYTTPLLNTLMRAELRTGERTQTLSPLFGIYHRFGLLILLAFILGGVYFRQSPQKERRLSIGLICFFLAVFHVLMLLLA